MMRTIARPGNKKRQVALVLAIATIHLLLLYALLALRQPPVRRDAVLERVMMLIAHPVQPTGPAPPPPPPLRDVPVVVAAPDIVIAPDARPPLATIPVPPGGGCAIERSIAEAAADDPHVRAALAAMGPARADTGAINLWNGSWVVAPDAADVARLATLHPIIRAAIADAAKACGEAEQVGPRLIAIPGQARPVLLVIGSGRWRWSDLMRQPAGGV